MQIAINYGHDLPEPQILERQDAVYNVISLSSRASVPIPYRST